MILICYDRSDDAKAAIRHGGSLLAGQPATVLTVWEPVRAMSVRAPAEFMFLPSLLDADQIDQANADAALTGAEEGTKLASAAGFNAEPLTSSKVSTVAQTILSQADKLDASAILMGSRGLTGLKSLLLGSVSHAVIQHADRPVIVVPSSNVALSRTKLRTGTGDENQTKIGM